MKFGAKSHVEICREFNNTVQQTYHIALSCSLYMHHYLKLLFIKAVLAIFGFALLTSKLWLCLYCSHDPRLVPRT